MHVFSTSVSKVRKIQYKFQSILELFLWYLQEIANETLDGNPALSIKGRQAFCYHQHGSLHGDAEKNTIDL